ncbi:GntR family transcriptional regulator [Cytobacillus spongiae]|jgi:GntR family transcriptional regulator|uniref:GntR family transcriptional regulator n=1 Tax=Cytobacillus spongiae TaxID=2901381 RepID=UPI001F473AB3|nr:GntR family transcriptional regulator [Cytobacillus spongiae]UII54993.1 GntR family transcriptional regulator [Cytobacillus spongiae]
MGEEFQASKPIYLQIVDKVCHQIARNELLPGDKLPSVREMAIKSGVNPNTIQRTYSELERMAIVETKRGQGTFVTENETAVKELKFQLQRSIIEAFFTAMKDLGFSEEEMIDGLQSYIVEKQVSHDD